MQRSCCALQAGEIQKCLSSTTGHDWWIRHDQIWKGSQWLLVDPKTVITHLAVARKRNTLLDLPGRSFATWWTTAPGLQLACLSTRQFREQPRTACSEQRRSEGPLPYRWFTPAPAMVLIRAITGILLSSDHHTIQITW